MSYFNGVIPEDLKVLENNDFLYPESNKDNYVLKNDFDKIVYSPEFHVLGCLNGYIFTSEGTYIGKYTLEGVQIAKIHLETEYGTFYEGCKHFYCWYENVLYKVSQQLEIEWAKEFDLNVASAYIDCKGDCYVLFESSRTIRKILKSGEESVYIDGSDTPDHSVTLHRLFITKGGGWLYVLGTDFYGYNNTVEIFIDKYNARTWDKVERLIVKKDTFRAENDPDLNFVEFALYGDYYYIFSKNSITKINIKGRHYWTMYISYDEEIQKIHFTDSNYSEDFLFSTTHAEGYSDNVFSFNKANVNGNMIWHTYGFLEESPDFRWAYYQNKIYTSMRSYVESKKEYLLSVDDDKLLFQTRNGHLIKIIKYNSEEIFSADNYYGMRLLASSIKDGIDKIVYSPLRHDDGDMINEDEDLILLPLENEHYTDLENYDYKYLLASQYKIDPPEVSILYTKALQPILTQLKNVIKTKSPVIPDTVHEFITNAAGARLDTSKDFDIVRARYRYSFDKYLLADINMFSTDIITKRLGYTIITKKYGHDIIMKTRKIYTYVFSKFTEIDMIAEWLKENGVMDTVLPDIVEELKHHTYDAIQDIQIAGTPQIYDVQAYKQFEYTYDGYKYINNTWGTQIFSCTNLPWDKRKCIAKIYIDSLANIIKKQEMRPILFFLNGKAIPWSDCTIVRDWSYNYLLIKNHDPYESDLSAIIFPCDIRYGEDNNVLDEDQVNGYFYFDDEGNSIPFEDRENTAIRVEVIDKNIWGAPTTETPMSPDGTSLFEVLNKEDQKASERNMIVFEDGLLFPDARYYMVDKGKDVFEYTRMEPLDVMVKAFYWIKANSYYGLEEKPRNQALMLKGGFDDIYDDVEVKGEILEDGLYDNLTDRINEGLYTPFNFKMKRSKTYEQNISDALSYIIQYDTSLLKNYWKKISYISSFTFTGEYLINRVPDDGGWLLMPRSRKSQYDDYIMVFRNNKIYEYYKEIDYTDCYFKIPIFNHVERTDIIEVVHFKNIDNRYYTMTVNKDEPDYLPESIRYDDFLLSGNSPSTEDVYIPFNRENSIQYDISFKYKNNFENDKYKNTSIELEDEFYYGKEINVYSKRQFHYMYYNMFSPRNTINLSPDFRFCHDKSKYLVFINGIRLPDYCWKLNIMTNEVKRKYISISLNNNGYTKTGDLVEIFYLPISKVSTDTGHIISHYEHNDYKKTAVFSYNHYDGMWYGISIQSIGLDKELYHVYINGQKINNDAIDNISKDTIAVDVDTIDKIYDTLYKYWNDYVWNYIPSPPPSSLRGMYDQLNIEFDTYMVPELLLSKLFSYSDLWSDTIRGYGNVDPLRLMEPISEDYIREQIKRAVARMKR